MHKITRFLHLFKNYIFDTSENRNTSQSFSTVLQNRKTIAKKPTFVKKNFNKSKIYFEESNMIGNGSHTITPSDNLPKKYLEEESNGKDDLNSQNVNGEIVDKMSFNNSTIGQINRVDNSLKDINYCPITHNNVKIESLNEKKTRIIKSLLSMKVLSLIIFVFMGTLSVCTLRYVRFRPVETMYIASVGLIIGEIFKLILSMTFLTYESKSFKKALKTLYIGTIVNWKDTLNTGIPAFLYAIQNLLFQYAISYLDATVLLVTQQLKILTTALFAVTILKSKLSGIQWLSMIILIIGIILIQWKLPESKKDDIPKINAHAPDVKPKEIYYPLPNPLNIPPQIIGLIMVFIGTVLSGFSAIFLERIFKKTTQSLWCLNFQLALISVPILVCVSLITDYSQLVEKGFFGGFDGWIVLVYFVYGLHGMIVALLLKHASSILKCFASGFIIAATAIISIFIFNVIPNWLLIVGTIIILLSVYLYSKFPYKRKDIIVLTQKSDSQCMKA